jgi:serine/threonine-protein kinase CTR1
VSDNFDEKSDVYSIAMIAWQLMTLQTPFENLSLENVKRYVVNMKSRPKLDKKYFLGDLAHLIRVCWQGDVSSRPKFHQIESFIVQLLTSE